MPNLDLLLDDFRQVVESEKAQQTQLLTVDLRNADSQFRLDKQTRDQCNFSRHWDLPISDWFLRPHRYSGRFSESI